jgi:hypothetical protein
MLDEDAGSARERKWRGDIHFKICEARLGDVNWPGLSEQGLVRMGAPSFRQTLSGSRRAIIASSSIGCCSAPKTTFATTQSQTIRTRSGAANQLYTTGSWEARSMHRLACSPPKSLFPKMMTERPAPPSSRVGCTLAYSRLSAPNEDSHDPRMCVGHLNTWHTRNGVTKSLRSP